MKKVSQSTFIERLLIIGESGKVGKLVKVKVLPESSIGGEKKEDHEKSALGGEEQRKKEKACGRISDERAKSSTFSRLFFLRFLVLTFRKVEIQAFLFFRCAFFSLFRSACGMNFSCTLTWIQQRFTLSSCLHLVSSLPPSHSAKEKLLNKLHVL